MSVEGVGSAAARSLPLRALADKASSRKQPDVDLPDEAAPPPQVYTKGAELRISVPYDHHVEVRIVDPETGQALQTINEADPDARGHA